MSEAQAATKQCPRCAETIKLEALVCHFCHQEFAVTHLGYCATCHRQVDVGSGSVCPTCGNEVTDVTTFSEPVAVSTAAPMQPAPAPAAGAAPGRGRSETTRVAMGAITAMVGGILVVIASFLPWFKYLTTVSGWDIFDGQTKLGGNPFLIEHMFSAAFNPLFTGLTTVILGVLAAATALVILISPRPPLPQRYAVPLPLVVLSVIVGIVLLAVTAANLSSYVIGGKGFGAEIGVLILPVGGLLALVGFISAINRPVSMWRVR
jgi:hypothetical protein